MKVEYITCLNGGWVVLKVNGDLYHSGHSVPDSMWLSLLYSMEDVVVHETEVTDKDMEEGNY